MTSLKRDPKSGDWVARKGIPKDVREAYRRLANGSWEARFRRPGNLNPTEAKRQFAEWLAEVEGRVARIKSEAAGEGTVLSTKQARALSGDWYRWFLAQREDEPGEVAHWESFQAEHEDVDPRARSHDDDDPEQELDVSPRERLALDQFLSRHTELETFLAEKGLVLAPETRATFIRFLSPDFWAARRVLIERCQGVYARDPRVATFPTFERARPQGVTCWGLFEAWVAGRQPAPATVNRWRCVFLDLDGQFPKRAAASITEAEARAWKDGLITADRSAATVRDIWVNASGTVFGWAAEHKKVPSNPFGGLKVDVPQAKVTRESPAFTDEEVRAILKATTVPPEGRLAQHHTDTRRWVPWLCAYTGSRPGEMTQLRGQDVRQEQGAWVVTITPEAGSVKTGRARTVPLHEHLIDQGFLAFIRERGPGPLFYNPSGARKKPTANDATNPAQTLAAKSRVRLGEWVRSIGVTDSEVRPSHAWRHTFKRRAARFKIEKRIRNGFCGHAAETVGDQYETPELVDLIEAIKHFPRYSLEAAPDQDQDVKSGEATSSARAA